MVSISFSVSKYRLVELKHFIRENLSSARFECDPINLGDNKYSIHLSMNVQDSNVLNTLLNKWYDQDNSKPIKRNWFGRFIDWMF